MVLDSTWAGIGVCSTEDVKEYIEGGFSAKEIRELCKKESGADSSGGSRPRGDGPDGIPPVRVPPAYRCGCYGGYVCPLREALPQGAPCFCVTPFGSCQGQAY